MSARDVKQTPKMLPKQLKTKHKHLAKKKGHSKRSIQNYKKGAKCVKKKCLTYLFSHPQEPISYNSKYYPKTYSQFNDNEINLLKIRRHSIFNFASTYFLHFCIVFTLNILLISSEYFLIYIFLYIYLCLIVLHRLLLGIY